MTASRAVNLVVGMVKKKGWRKRSQRSMVYALHRKEIRKENPSELRTAGWKLGVIKM